MKNPWLYVSLIAASAIFLYLERLTNFEFMYHLAAVPIEILLGALLVKRYLGKKEKAERLRQLMYIKSYMFRAEMKNLFTSNFHQLTYPEITISEISKASLERLRQMRREADHVEYKSPEGIENIITEYSNSSRVFHNFMERAIQYNLESIFQDMIFILHFIQDFKLFKKNNPDGLFIHEAQKDPLLMEKTMKVLGDGIRKFLDYAIELKEKHPEMFSSLMADYEISFRLKDLRVKTYGEV